MLINRIIDLLSDEGSSLSEALLKTKVLLHQIGKKELAEWVNQELNGYTDRETVPDYRKLPAQVLANASNAAWRVSSHPIPTMHLPEEMRTNFETAYFQNSLAVLEEFAKEESGHIAGPIPMECNGLLSQGLGNNFKVERAWCQTSTHDVKGILTQVRSRLLDFILELRDQMGDISDDDDLKKKAASVDAAGLFNNAIFGSNTTIVVGHHNSQLVHNNSENDLAGLLQNLRSAGIPADEIDQLRHAVEADQTSIGKPSFDGQTGSWFTRLLGKAAKGGLGVGVDVVSGTVAKLLTGYIGGGG